MIEIHQSASRVVMLKLFDTGTTNAATGKTLAVVISKNGGAFANPSAGATNATELANGWYSVTLSTTDTNTLGDLIVRGTATGCDPSERVFAVVDAVRRGMTALPNADAGANLGLPLGDAQGRVLLQTSQPGVTIPTVTTLTNLPAIPTNWLTGPGIDATAVTKIQNGLATPTNITGGTITTVTNLTNLPAIPTNWLTGLGVDASAVTKIQSGLATPTNITAGTITTVTNVTNGVTLASNQDVRNVTGNVSGKVLGGGVTAITGVGVRAVDGSGNAIAPAATALSTAQWTNTRAGYLDNIAAAPLTSLGANAPAGWINTAAFAAGATLPVVTTLTNLPSVPTNWLTGLGVDTSAVTKIQNGLATPTNITAGTITTVSGSVGSVTSAVTVGTINPNVVNASALASDAVTEIQSGLATQATLLQVAGYVDTEVGSILSVTNKLDTMMELDGSVYRLTVNALEQAPVGGGGGATDWTADEKTAIRTILGVPLTGTTPEVPSAGALKVIDDLIDTEVGAIKAKTDNLPSDPAGMNALAVAHGAGSWATATGFAVPGDAMAITTLSGNALVSGVAAQITADHGSGSYVRNTEPVDVSATVNAIKAKTDNLPSDPADQSILQGLLDAIKVKTDTIPASPASVSDIPTVNTIWTTALTEAYRATGATGTAAQLLYELVAHMGRKTVTGTAVTLKRLDGTTTAKAFTLDSSPPSASISEA